MEATAKTGAITAPGGRRPLEQSGSIHRLAICGSNLAFLDSIAGCPLAWRMSPVTSRVQ